MRSRCAWSSTTTSSSYARGLTSPIPTRTELKKLNEEESTLTNAFITKLLAATKDGAFVTTDKAALAGLSDARITAAALAAKERKLEGYLIPLHNTTQQPELDSLSQRATRQAIFENSWNRAERGGENDTRDIVCPAGPTAVAKSQIARLSQLRRVETGRPDGEKSGRRAEVHGCAGARRDRESH